MKDLKKFHGIVVFAMVLLCGSAHVFAGSVSGTAGSVTVTNENATGNHYTVKIHYEAFDGTDDTDPMGVTAGKVQFAYILEYLDGNSPVLNYDIESINAIPIEGYASIPDPNITVNGVNTGTAQTYSVLKTEYIPGGNNVIRFVFYRRGAPSQLSTAGARSEILVYTASDDSWFGKVLGIVVGSSLSASDKVLGPAPTLVPTKPRTPGYWKHQFGGKGKKKESPEQLTGYLTDIKSRSGVFAGLAGDVDADRDAVLLILTPVDSSVMRDKAKRQLLAMWLNIASGKIDWYLPVDFDPAVFNTTATSVGEAIEQTEAAILSSSATDAELENVKDMIDMLNNM